MYKVANEMKYHGDDVHEYLVNIYGMGLNIATVFWLNYGSIGVRKRYMIIRFRWSQTYKPEVTFVGDKITWTG